MILYNVTVSLTDNTIEAKWVEWMQQEHLPDVMQTGLFTDCRFLKVLNEVDSGHTYSVQYTCQSMEDYNAYKSEHAERLQADTNLRFGGKFVAFRTLLEYV